jgi:hypothetical protein
VQLAGTATLLQGATMPFMREPIRVQGVLSGQGEKANCMVSAVKVTLEGTRLSRDCGISITWTSAPLPEGNYTLTFDDKTIPMNFSQGTWKALTI